MLLTEALAAAARDQVEVIPGRLWVRIRCVRSAELLAAGGAALFAAQPPGPEVSAEATIRRVLSADPGQVGRFSDQVVAAGVEALSNDGVTWQDCRIVLERKAANPSAGALFVGDLPGGASLVLFERILALSTDGGAAGERLARFLGG